jgi:hypothetical protein
MILRSAFAMPNCFETPYDALNFITIWNYNSAEELEIAIKEVVSSREQLLISMLHNELKQYMLPAASDGFMLTEEPNEHVTSDRFGNRLYVDMYTLRTRLVTEQI